MCWRLMSGASPTPTQRLPPSESNGGVDRRWLIPLFLSLYRMPSPCAWRHGFTHRKCFMPSAVSLSENGSVPHKVWWREPYFWLVIGGPLVVVVAGIATAVIAVKNPDPVLDPRNVAQSEFMVQSKQAQSAKDQLVNLQPAMLGRNHAASPLPLAPAAQK